MVLYSLKKNKVLCAVIILKFYKMKTTNKFIRTALMLFVTSLVFTSCSPEDGKDGEQGPMGNANVKVFTRDLTDLTWTTVGNSNSGYLRMEVSATNVLTSEVLEKSTILVYVYTSDFGGDWALLPYYTERDIRCSAEVMIGKIILKKDQEGKPYTQSWHNKIKVVIIEESSSGVLSRRFPNKNFQEMSYYEVMDYFGLEY